MSAATMHVPEPWPQVYEHQECHPCLGFYLRCNALEGLLACLHSCPYIATGMQPSPASQCTSRRNLGPLAAHPAVCPPYKGSVPTHLLQQR